MGVELPATLVFDYPSVAAMSGFLAHQIPHTSLHAAEPSKEEVYSALGQYSGAHGRPMREECMGVAAAASLTPCGDIATSAFFSHDGPTPVLSARWDADALADCLSTPPVPFGSFVADAHLFDHACFRIHQTEATLMDPQQRLLLLLSHNTLLSSAPMSP